MFGIKIVIVLSGVGIVSPRLYSFPNTPQTAETTRQSRNLKKRLLLRGWLYAGYTTACKNIFKTESEKTFSCTFLSHIRQLFSITIRLDFKNPQR